MSNSAEVATVGAGNSTSSSLSEAQLSAFWAGIVANLDAARGMAAQFVSRQSVEDVVNSAAIRFIEWLERPKKPVPFPKTDDDFRREFLFIVRNYAIDCVRDPNGTERPIHSHWAKAPEPIVGGRKVADRTLDSVFARNDQAQYDAPVPAEQCTKEDIAELHQILRYHLADLPLKQRQVIRETFFEGRKRAEVARRHNMRVKTYDNHLQAAFRSLRYLLSQTAKEFAHVERSRWYDLIEELRKPYRPPRLRRAAGKKGERSNFEGERRNSERERVKNSRAGAA